VTKQTAKATALPVTGSDRAHQGAWPSAKPEPVNEVCRSAAARESPFQADQNEGLSAATANQEQETQLEKIAGAQVGFTE